MHSSLIKRERSHFHPIDLLLILARGFSRHASCSSERAKLRTLLPYGSPSRKSRTMEPVQASLRQTTIAPGMNPILKQFHFTFKHDGGLRTTKTSQPNIFSDSGCICSLQSHSHHLPFKVLLGLIPTASLELSSCLMYAT